MHNKWVGIIAGLLILIFLYLDNAATMWVIGIIGVLMILHTFCPMNSCSAKPKKKK
jgi:hypothetical protein